MNFKISDLTKKVLLFLVFCILLIIISTLTLKSNSNKVISDIKEFIKTDTKLLYITNEKKYNKEVEELLSEYEVEYMYIDIAQLDKIDKTRLEKIINSKYLTNIIVVYENGDIKDALIDYENYDSLTTFLKQYNIIPKILKSNTRIIEQVEEKINSDYLLMYLPYEYDDHIDDQDSILREICDKYDIKYKQIDAYLLSNNQKEKLNQILQISKVENQIIILIKNGKIIGSIRELEDKYEYLKKLYEFNFIEEKVDIVNSIGVDSFSKIIESNSKSIIVLGTDNCNVCDKVLNKLSEILINSEYTINYLNIKSFDSDISKTIQDKIKSIGYEDGFTTPMVIISENNRILDYIIGLSEDEYYIDIFKQNRIIR